MTKNDVIRVEQCLLLYNGGDACVVAENGSSFVATQGKLKKRDGYYAILNEDGYHIARFGARNVRSLQMRDSTLRISVK